MNSDILAQLIAVGAGVLITIAFRLVDKYLPDPEGKYPLPKTTLTPGASAVPPSTSPPSTATLPGTPLPASGETAPTSAPDASDGRSTGSGGTP